MKDIDVQLIKAAGEGDFENFKSLHQQGADINAEDWGRGALSAAAIGGHIDIVKYIMQQNQSIDFEVNIELGDALREKQPKAAELLLSRYKVETSTFVFRKAADNGYIDIYKKLLDIHVADEANLGLEELRKAKEFKGLLLRDAIRNRNEEVIKILINDYHASFVSDSMIHLIDKKFLETGKAVRIMKCIFKKDNDINMKLPKDIVTRYRCYLIHKFAKLEDDTLIKFAIKKGAEVSAVDSKGDTALHILMSNINMYVGDKKEVIATLLEKGADINARNEDGNTPLHALVERKYISYNDKKELLEFLIIDCQADVHIKNDYNSTVTQLIEDRWEDALFDAIDKAYANKRKTNLTQPILATEAINKFLANPQPNEKDLFVSSTSIGNSIMPTTESISDNGTLELQKTFSTKYIDQLKRDEEVLKEDRRIW